MSRRLSFHRKMGASREQLELFRSLPGDLAVRDSQDLMAWPFFSLAKSKRVAPIDFRMGQTWISVEAVPEHGMATIWDADVLIWAASQIVEARDAGLKSSRLLATRPHEILTFTGRGTGRDHYDRLKAALDRLQSTTVATSIRQQDQRRRHRFSWINEWRELADDNGRALGIEPGRDRRTQRRAQHPRAACVRFGSDRLDGQEAAPELGRANNRPASGAHQESRKSPEFNKEMRASQAGEEIQGVA